MKFNIWNDFPEMDLPDTLSFIVDNRGKTVPTDEEGNHILIATNCIKNENLYPVYEKVRRLNEETYQTWFRAHPIPGDIIFVNKGTPGKVCLVPDPVDFCIAQDMMAFRVNNDVIYNKYLFAVLRSKKIQSQITATSVGDVIPHFKKQHLHDIKIPIPPRDIQETIGDFYFSLCQKVEVNKKIIADLIETARIQYKSRFIDIEQNNGELIDGWKRGTVEEIVNLHDSMRKPLSAKERENLAKIYPYYGATSIMDYVDNYLFDGIYLLLGEDGSVMDDNGFPFLQYVSGKFWPNNHAHIISGKNGFTVELLYLLFSHTKVKEIVTGAVQQKISQQNLKKLEVTIPSIEALNDFDAIIQPMFAEVRKLRTENEKIIGMLDSVMPKLMSGKYEFKED